MGVGFVGAGHSSNKNNLGIRGGRKSMGDNPYRGSKGKKRLASNYDEIQRWKEKKEIRMKKLRRIIFISLTILAVVTIILVYFN